MVAEPSASAERSARRSRPTAVYVVCAVLLGAPFVALLWVSSYAKQSPRLWGFPFFYWYQFLWVIISAVLTFVAYVLMSRTQPKRPDLGEREPRR